MRFWKLILCAAFICCMQSVCVYANEQLVGEKIVILYGQDSTDEIITFEPAIITTGDDMAVVWSSSDVLSDEADTYYIVTDFESNNHLYEVELISGDNLGMLAAFELVSDADEISKQFRMSSAYSDEVVDCYFFGDNLYENVVPIQLDAVEEIDDLYWTDYIVGNGSNNLNSVYGIGALIDSYGDCVGLLCPEPVEGKSILLFSESIWRNSLNEAYEDAFEEDSWDDLITTPRSRAGTR